jgi:small subunit ribosomal protein S12
MRYEFLKHRSAREYKNKKKLLSRRRPLRRGVVTKAVLRSPKKPHSSKRATVKFCIQKDKRLKNYAYILGEGGRRRLKKYDIIYFRGGHRRDIPAMKYTAVHGVTTSTGKSGSLHGLTNQRTKSRSKYAAKPKLNPKMGDSLPASMKLKNAS